ncbi:MAG TPA: hypothetical protein VM143_03335 [Acidimicrobiales bacterium]|nr:hypothetical protein [Acidimicrobiales bacterium]
MNEPLVEAEAIAFERERPPLGTLRLDVRLRNPEVEPRWFLLPEKLGASPLPPPGGIFGGEPVRVVGGTNAAVVVTFRGAHGFRALALPPVAKVRLRGLPLRTVGSPPGGSFTIDVALVTSLLVDGVQAPAWLGSDLRTDRVVDAKFADARRLPSRYTPDYLPVPVSVDQVHLTSAVVQPASSF